MNDRFRSSHSASQGMGRRSFLRSAAAAMAVPPILASSAEVQPVAEEARPKRDPSDTYENQAKGIRILPGAWRPHYPWEHIAWVSPSWPSQDYIWLDFPEAIFTDRGLVYLSHINPAAPAIYENWPKVPWQEVARGIEFERVLPDGVAFGGRVTRGEGTTVDLELHIRNGSQAPLKEIKLQTCAFLRAAKEFADYKADNKYVHVPEHGWIPFPEAKDVPEGTSRYGVGWRSSNRKADLPVMATLSNQAERLVAMTWLEDTMSMVCNPRHPCMHADPHFPDLDPGEGRSVHGRLMFFEGGLNELQLKY